MPAIPAGQPVTYSFHGGQLTFVRSIVLDGKNVGTTDCALAVTYVLDKGAPMRNAATP